MKNYIVGYGSLISRESRLGTGGFRKCIPVNVIGFRREWNVVIPEERATYLGVVNSESYNFNGVIFSISEGDLEKFDKRETKYYERILVDEENIKFLSSKIDLDDSKIWLYVTRDPQAPSKKYPILRSYVNTVLSGVLRLDKEFYREFIKTTFNWEIIYEDLDNPRYPYSVESEEILLNKQMLSKLE